MDLDQSRCAARRFKRSAFLLRLLAGGLLVGHSALAEIPRGVFCLNPAGVRCREQVLANPSIDGISIRQDWKDLEPSAGVYDWSFLDEEMARATAAGKQIFLRINTQANKPAWVTGTVAAAGGVFFTFEHNGARTSVPVFWDPTFLREKIALIQALGAHFAGNPALKIVWASFANANSEDWSVPHTPADVAAWRDLGYTSEKMLDAGRQIIDATMTAFPDQFVTLAVAPNGSGGRDGRLDPDPDYVARNAVSAARLKWSGRLIVQKNSLAAFSPPAPGRNTVFQILWDSQPAVGGQMLDASYGDSTFRNNRGMADNAGSILHKSIALGVGYGMKFIEIYQQDVLNLPDEISYAHQALLGASNSVTAPPQAPAGLRLLPSL